jgi:negative regulator of flagellin synthesis FlgM|tara:strand:- start:408 stop:710 length:303 start_codon:yes stop_codon:yes gene_type:complete
MMTDPISGLGRAQAQINTASDKAKNNRAGEAPEAVASKPSTPVADELVLSDTATTALANAEFDTEKVAKIKAAIEAGSYPLDPERIAESFASLESMIGGK